MYACLRIHETRMHVVVTEQYHGGTPLLNCSYCLSLPNNILVWQHKAGGEITSVYTPRDE